jgi:hypothetical protein
MLSTLYGQAYFIAPFWQFLYGSGAPYPWASCGIYSSIILIVYLEDYGPDNSATKEFINQLRSKICLAANRLNHYVNWWQPGNIKLSKAVNARL